MNKINKRLIICGPTCSGKNYLRNKFTDQGFKHDISYTTRERREGEISGIDYHFLSTSDFEDSIKKKEFYEWVQYEGKYYGTGQKEWDTCNTFIMETDGISKLSKKDRAKSFVIYLNPAKDVREMRMTSIRFWEYKKVLERREVDLLKFKDFKDYDMMITNYNF